MKMSKGASSVEILEVAKKIFFPQGESPKGNITEFHCELLDFSERKVKDSTTIKEMYEETKMPLLRFYIRTTSRKGKIVAESDASRSTTPALATPSTSSTLEGFDIVANAMITSGITESDSEKLPLVDLSVPLVTSTFVPTLTTDTAPSTLNVDTFPLATDTAPSSLNVDSWQLSEGKVVKIKIHRGQVLMGMIQAFKTIDVMALVEFEIIMPNGNTEEAEDGGGVTRDLLTEFWQDFHDQCTLGISEKVPFLRHNFGEEEWTSLAHIVKFGWTNQGYFPMQLSLPFVQQCIFGKYSADLVQSFFKIIPAPEKQCYENAMQDFMPFGDEFDELVDFLDSHDVRQAPSKENTKRLLEEVSHKELIQAPMFVADCWQLVLNDIGLTQESLHDLYEKLNPSPRKVCQLLSFPDNMTVEQVTVSNHLKRFIRELTDDNIKKFLRYCTGSDLIIAKEITVAFVRVTGLARRPVAHTCSCLLELSTCYDSFPQFRSEFLGVLASKIWVMDII